MGLFRRKSTSSALLEDAPRPPSPAPAPKFEPGVPGRCPECDGYGYVDHIDMVKQYQAQHCRSCGHQWEFSFADDEPVGAEPVGADVIDLTSADTTVD